VHSLEILEVDPQCADALSLLREAAIEARSLYPDPIPADAPWPKNAPTLESGVYLVAYVNALPVACGALRPIDKRTVEVRRMFVTRTRRRGGLARSVLTALEARARQFGYAVMKLETGDRQSPAMALYTSCGFTRIPPFDEYENDPTSVCFEKPVAGAEMGGA